jgi:hypothetical protein
MVKHAMSGGHEVSLTMRMKDNSPLVIAASCTPQDFTLAHYASSQWQQF